MKLPEWLKNFGLTGERRAIALLALCLLMAFYLVVGLGSVINGEPVAPYMMAMSAVYLVAFFSLGAEWFWARWFASGLAWSGFSMALYGLLSLVRVREQLPPELLQIVLIFFAVLGGLHGLIGVALLGPRVGERYNGRDDWRKRWQLDDQGALKVRSAVTRAANALPMLIALTLAPGQESMAGAAAFSLSVIGLIALLRGRALGVLALGTAGITVIVGGLAHPMHLAIAMPGSASPLVPASFMIGLPFLAGALLLAAVAPFVRPVAAHLARR